MTEAKVTPGRTATDDPEAEAAEWVIRLGDPRLAQSERRAFDAWMAQGPLYRETFRVAQATWDELGGLEPMDWAPGHVPTARSRWKAAVAGFAASALAAAFIMGGVFLWSGNPLTAWMSDHATARGELRVVTLPDGSMAELGPDSALNVAFSATGRRVVLLRGEAYFTIAPKGENETRPFLVEAGGLIAKALGTQFAVDIMSGGVRVVVTEHAVRVRAAHARQPRARVGEGEAVLYTPDRRLTDVAPIRTEFETAWREGRLVFDNRPLGEVVEELNRYRNGRIVIRGEALAKRRVSGIFKVSDAAGAVSRVARELGLRTMDATPLMTILY